MVNTSILNQSQRDASVVNASGLAFDAVSANQLPDMSIDNKTTVSNFDVVVEESKQL